MTAEMQYQVPQASVAEVPPDPMAELLRSELRRYWANLEIEVAAAEARYQSPLGFRETSQLGLTTG